MGLFTDTVPRDLYDALQARYDDLLAKYHSLRPTHSPVAPLRVTAPKEEPGLATLHAAEAAINNPHIARIADNIMREQPSLSRQGALLEAKRLDDIRRGRAVAPSAASPPEPPSR